MNITEIRTAADLAAVEACRPELEAMTKAQVADCMRQLGLTPMGSRAAMIGRLLEIGRTLVIARQRIRIIDNIVNP